MVTEHILRTVGYFGIFAIIFAESGLLVGFFLPGDSLLFAAGLLSAQHVLNIWIVMPVMFVAAVLGVNAGYSLGQRFGERMFAREDALIFNPKHLEVSKRFYDKHGGKAVILARFTPVARSLAPILAGVGNMQFRRFMLFNVVGAALWVTTVTLIGYFFGNAIPHVERYSILMLLLVLLFSTVPPLVRVWRDDVARARLLARIGRKPKS
jgi:membrane-associated protein